MFELRVIRALVAPNRTNFFLDHGQERGIVADALAELEKHLNATLDVGARKMRVLAVPVTRDDLIPLLAAGRGEIAVGSITITPERQKLVDFTVPTSKPIDELVVTGPQSPSLESLDDLAGQSVYIRPSSSYWASLEKLNTELTARGLAPIELEPANEYLETEDILEMVNAGLIPITIADSYLAQFWSDVFPNLVVHEDLKVAEGRLLGWAVRKDATGLKEKLDPWIEANRQGTLLGNMLIKRYLKENVWVKNAAAEEERQRFLSMLELFKKYGSEYGLEPLLLAAQGFQESGLDQSKRSRVGAIGVMQVMPKTANDPAVGIPEIEVLEPNIHAGTKYVRHLIDVYFDDENVDDLNRLLFAFAGYNAGPSRINRLRKVAADEGLDPNQWFRNVEFVVAREVGREPVQYVSNIYKYFVVYEMMLGRELERASG
ncbi:MAG: lytic transglycosylase F [Acidobacteriota bacterium]